VTADMIEQKGDDDDEVDGDDGDEDDLMGEKGGTSLFTLTNL